MIQKKEASMKNVFFYQIKIGKIAIEADETAVLAVRLSHPVSDKEVKETPLIQKAYQQIDEYLTGKRKVFDIPMRPEGTEFQKKVWQVLEQIPYGETWTYKQLAEKTGNVKACRAVGNANNKNKLPIFIPCHRVIGCNGKLVGYAGGLEVKKALLNLEALYR